MPGQSKGVDPQTEYRKLPAVDLLLREASIAELVALHGQRAVISVLRTLLDQARQAIAGGASAPVGELWPLLASAALDQQQPSLRAVINATGVIIHTNLGRAPLSQAALTAIATLGAGYTNLEYDLEAGARGSRYDHARSLLREVTGAEDALVVNNNAAALYLVLAALCHGRGVLISRGQLIEIGGGFRIPDVLAQSGAHLVEVGTTNRTHLRDFADALTVESAAILRVHHSNFKQIGFVTAPELGDLADLVQRHNAIRPTDPLLLIDDLGSGTLLDTAHFGLAAEPMVQASIAAGADIVTFSGDKLLGGPQAGIILGRKVWLDRVRRHPMARALRVDKLTLAALDATLRSYQRGQVLAEVPVWQMISVPLDCLRQRAANWQAALESAGVACRLEMGESAVGGGSLPGETLPTMLLAVPLANAGAAAAHLRNARRPILCRIQHDALLFDPRTVLPDEDDRLVQGLLAALTS
jgi:L-seryl-tRNA(Ser) seleniumtransferase